MNEVMTRKWAEDFKILIDDVEELVKVTANQAGERIGDLRQRLENKIENGRKALAGRGIDWFEKPEQAQTAAELQPREKGWAALVIASAIGVVLGLLLRRRGMLR